MFKVIGPRKEEVMSGGKSKEPVRLKNADERALFAAGERWTLAWLAIGNAFGGQLAMTMMATVGTLQALSFELYLKSLAHIEHGKGPLFTHNLTKLVQDVSGDAQKEFEKSWDDEFQEQDKETAKNPNLPDWYVVPTSFSQALDLSKDAFTQLRYGEKGSKYLIGQVSIAARREVLKLRPGWRPSTDLIDPRS
jgi:hypothetical protein